MKVPEPRKLKSGSYFIQLRLDGVSVPITASSARECKRAAELIKAEHRAGKALIRKIDMTLQEAETVFLRDRKASLSPTTYRSYKSYKENRFPAYLHKKLDDIEWQKMINRELETKSPKTVENAWGFVHAALKYVGYQTPEVKLADVPVSEMPFLQPEEILPFCEAVKGRNYELAALIELHGLRLSEARALTWDMVDLKKGLIRVRGALVRGVDGDVRKPTNKNKTSTRIVPIMIPQLADALARCQQAEGPVVKQSSNTLLDDVKRSCVRAGVTVVGNHGLRHSFASLCYHLNIPERQLMEWGGWADYQTMHKIYIRLAASDRTKYQAEVEGFFQKNANENANGFQKV